MLIRELEHETGLERATIRFYEKEGFITPQRADNGYRTYSKDDCETLLKIKLLRQLGMPLDKIKNLQQGSDEFTDVLNEQIAVLEKQIQDSVRAKEVCAEIRDCVTSYNTLDARYYLDALNRPSIDKPKWQPSTVPEFHQATPIHPWKRFFARSFDLGLFSGLLFFLVMVVLRVRPINAPIYTVLGWEIVTFLIWIPLEALLLHFLGTTPGKWIMGIRVESVNGGNLSISVAMLRGWNVLLYGYGLTIPFFSLWRHYKSYKAYQEEWSLSWDREWEAEIQFDYYYTAQKKVLIAVLAAAYLVSSVWTLNDRLRPTHRGADLTMEQLTENLNEMNELLEGERGGSTSSGIPGGVVINIGSKPVGTPKGPDFYTEDGIVRKITYSASYEDVFMLNIFNSYMANMTISVALAQDWMSLLCYNDFVDKISKAFKAEDGCFIYENLEVRWEAQAENCIYTGSTYYGKDNGQPSMVTYSIELFIHPVK